MKKILTTLLIITITSFLFAQETEIAEITQVSEIEQNEKVEIQKPTEKSEISENINENQSEIKKEKPKLQIQNIEQGGLLSGDNYKKFLMANEITSFTPNSVGKLKPKVGNIVIYEKEGLIGFESPYLLAYYMPLFDQETAILLNQAVNKYLSDFENKKLDRKDNKSFKKYGRGKLKVFWGLRQNSTPNNGIATCNFGYIFEEKSPYFTITIYPTYNIYLETNSSADKESMKSVFYFTKAQAKTLIDYISTESFNSLFSEKNTVFTELNIEEENY